MVNNAFDGREHFNDTNKLGSGKEMVERLTNLIAIFERKELDFSKNRADGDDIFNRVNSGGTKLSKGDLALAKICADWPDARDTMKEKIKKWNGAGYSFNLDWLLRSVNTVLTGEAKFQYLDGKSAEEIQTGLDQATKHIDTCLNLISGRLGLDHDRVFFGRFGVPVMVRYLEQRGGGALGAVERDKLVFWFAQAGMWGRFSGSTESFIDQDLAMLEGPDGSLDKLLDQLRLWHGGLFASTLTSPKSHGSAWNTSWSTNWSTYWSPHTTRISSP